MGKAQQVCGLVCCASRHDTPPPLHAVAVVAVCHAQAKALAVVSDVGFAVVVMLAKVVWQLQRREQNNRQEVAGRGETAVVITCTGCSVELEERPGGVPGRMIMFASNQQE